MPGKAITTASTLQCPHGGQVQISASGKAKADATIATVADTFTISGCSFQLPGPTPSPCVKVQWIVPDTAVKIGSNPTVSTTSVGLCLAGTGAPQGAVVIANTQPTVTTS
jgi:hypothetical protein